jgi:formate dehydrogenase major subunit
VPGLGTTYGRGGATTAPSDLLNSDAILIMGSNMAENHPVGFQWVMEAKEKGTHVIHIDPRFSRTSAVASTWVPLRAGSDILFLGGLINYILQNNLDFREYVVHYTNASVIVPESYEDPEELGGVFSGWHPETRKYDTSTWLYQGVVQPDQESDQGRQPREASGGHSKHGVDSRTDLSTYEQDLTLEHPRCVYQVLKKHFARYTPGMVAEFCGVSRDAFLNVAKIFTSASGPDKTGAICYALGWTQHSSGVQMIRAAAIMQLLLGNMGRPGGGILALRGHASIQGSTDIPTLFDSLPGYLAMPKLDSSSKTLASYIAANKPRSGFWNNFDKYIVSMLKAFYGDAATNENDYGFNWLPRLTGDHSHQGFWLDMMDGKMDGLFVIGQNPAVAGPNSGMERRALGKLKWLVVREMVETETATFWRDSTEVTSGEIKPSDIGTEVFLMPAAGHVEKDGTFTNTQRLLQWREKAIDPPGDARSENWFIYHLWRRIIPKAKLDPRPRNAGLLALRMDYTIKGAHREPEAEEILHEINGWTTADHKLLTGFSELKADGSTACGCWIYSGVFPAEGRNRANEREPKDEFGHGWGWAWPADRRVLYNRASAKPDGTPWSERKKLVWWDDAAKKWTGKDVPDFTATKPPNYVPPAGAIGDAALAGDKPYILHADGFGWLWVPVGLADGPLPTHYEPLESPVKNPIYPQRQANPVGLNRARPGNEYAQSPDARFPYVLTTYRLTEHHTAGGMSRTLSHLAELQPELFCEISMELARELKIEHGEWVTLVTARGAVEAHALSTSRMRPLQIGGKTVHQIGVPFHWGYNGLVKGDIGNDLTAISEEPNVRIMETKGLLCNLLVGRRADNAAKLREYHSLAAGKTA